jgi:hypothetical protein
MLPCITLNPSRQRLCPYKEQEVLLEVRLGEEATRISSGEKRWGGQGMADSGREGRGRAAGAQAVSPAVTAEWGER